MRKYIVQDKLASFASASIMAVAVASPKDLRDAMDNLAEILFPGERKDSKQFFIDSARDAMRQFDGIAFRIGPDQRASLISMEDAMETLKNQAERRKKAFERKVETIQEQVRGDLRHD